MDTVQKSNEEVKVEKKVIRRGIGTARGTTRLKFTHEIAKPNGLFLAHLDSVEVKTITIGEDKTGMPSFNGMELPKLVLTFASNEEDVNKRHYTTLQFLPVESNAETIPGGKDEWKINNIFDWLKHILNVYLLKGREFTDEEITALSLNYQDFNEDGDYEPVDVEEVVSSWKNIFNNFENICNRGGKDNKAIYKTTEGKILPVWIKLIRCIKTTKKGWVNVSGGDLSFPSIVGEGCVELFKNNVMPSLRIDTIRETILPKVIEDKAKTPNIGNPGMNTLMGGIPVDTMAGGLSMDNVAIAAADDMPF